MTEVKGLLIMDVDSTLIQEEGIDLLGEEAGVGDKIADITKRAMNGELDFRQALEERVGLLKGLPVSIFEHVISRIHFTTGAEKLVSEMHDRGYKVAVVSGGFHEMVDSLAKRIGLDYVKANRLDIQNGVLTGKILGEIVTKETKKASLIEWATKNNIKLSQTIAVGDGANDVPMIKTAGIGIAFCAKPIVRKEAPYQINEPNLYRVVDILDSKIS